MLKKKVVWWKVSSWNAIMIILFGSSNVKCDLSIIKRPTICQTTWSVALLGLSPSWVLCLNEPRRTKRHDQQCHTEPLWAPGCSVPLASLGAVGALGALGPWVLWAPWVLWGPGCSGPLDALGPLVLWAPGCTGSLGDRLWTEAAPKETRFHFMIPRLPGTLVFARL